MTTIKEVHCDPDWDYNSVWITLGETQNTIAELVRLLSSAEAEDGNLATDEKILNHVSKMEGDCRAIRKAIESQFAQTDLTKELPVEEENYEQASLHCLRDIRGQLLRVSSKISMITALLADK